MNPLSRLGRGIGCDEPRVQRDPARGPLAAQRT